MENSEQPLIDMARNETLLVARLLLKLAMALLVAEGVTWIFAGAPAPQPPAALTVVEKTSVNTLPSHAAHAPMAAQTTATR